MTGARNVADVLSTQQAVEVECIDRMDCNVSQPRLRHAARVAWRWRKRLGYPRRLRGAGGSDDHDLPRGHSRVRGWREHPAAQLNRGPAHSRLRSYLPGRPRLGRRRSSSAGRQRRSWSVAASSAGTRPPDVLWWPSADLVRRRSRLPGTQREEQSIESDRQPIMQGNRARPLQRGMFGMPKPQGWTIERVVNLMAGGVVVTTLILGCERSKRWRLLTGFSSPASSEST